MREHAETAHLALSTHITAGLPVVMGDERRLKQVILSLLANAIKFTPVDGTVTVGAVLTEENLRITTTDTSIGMPPEDIPVTLTAFGQIHSTYTKAHDGIGLGLPLAKCLIEMHEGS